MQCPFWYLLVNASIALRYRTKEAEAQVVAGDRDVRKDSRGQIFAGWNQLDRLVSLSTLRLFVPFPFLSLSIVTIQEASHSSGLNFATTILVALLTTAPNILPFVSNFSIRQLTFCFVDCRSNMTFCCDIVKLQKHRDANHWGPVVTFCNKANRRRSLAFIFGIPVDAPSKAFGLRSLSFVL